MSEQDATNTQETKEEVTTPSSSIKPDPTDHTRKHPLEHTWTFWYDPPRQGRITTNNWQSNVKKIMSFGSVEDFWNLFNNVRDPSGLENNCNYHLFKDGIEPSWEDPGNAGGGRWRVSFPVKSTAKLNQVWLNSAMALIGEAFNDSDNICGVAVNSRRSKNRVELWTKNGSDESLQMAIGQQWKELAEINVQIEFEVHQENGKGYKL